MEGLVRNILLYEGTGKKLFECEDRDGLLVEFKDDLSAFNALKKSTQLDKGSLNCKISTNIFNYLAQNGVKTHLIKQIDDTHMLCKRVNIIKVEVVVRNISTGSLSRRLNVIDGLDLIEDSNLRAPLIELYYKDDALNDPLVNQSHIILLNLATRLEIENITKEALNINDRLIKYFDLIDLKLVDIKLEFRRLYGGEIVLVDEISLDNCRLWDKKDNRKLDKDVFRQDIGDIKIAYEEVLNRILKKKSP